MANTSKGFALSLILLMAISSLAPIACKPANAQEASLLPIPSTPDFTVKIINSSYYEPVTYSIDRSTQQEIVNNSYYSGFVDALNITISIDNQPLALSVQSDTFKGFKYFIEIKPHNSDNWTSLTAIRDGFGNLQEGPGYIPSNTSLTVLTIQFSNPYFPVNERKEYPANSSGVTYATNPFFSITITKDELIDIRVRAGIGDLFYYSMGQLGFHGNYGDWNQLTITMANGETSTANLSPTPGIPEFVPIVILLLFAPTLFIAIKLRHRYPSGKSIF